MTRRDRAMALVSVVSVVSLVSIAFAGCIGGQGVPLQVVAKVSLASGGLDVSLLAEGEDGPAAVTVSYEGSVVYPVGERSVSVPLVDGVGRTFVPFGAFVIANGDYRVEADVGGRRAFQDVAVNTFVGAVKVQSQYANATKALLVQAVLLGRSGAVAPVLATGNASLFVHKIGSPVPAEPVKRAAADQAFDVQFRADRAEFFAGKGRYRSFVTFENDWARSNEAENDPSTATLAEFEVTE